MEGFDPVAMGWANSLAYQTVQGMSGQDAQQQAQAQQQQQLDMAMMPMGTLSMDQHSAYDQDTFVGYVAPQGSSLSS